MSPSLTMESEHTDVAGDATGLHTLPMAPTAPANLVLARSFGPDLAIVCRSARLKARHVRKQLSGEKLDPLSWLARVLPRIARRPGGRARALLPVRYLDELLATEAPRVLSGVHVYSQITQLQQQETALIDRVLEARREDSPGGVLVTSEEFPAIQLEALRLQEQVNELLALLVSSGVAS